MTVADVLRSLTSRPFECLFCKWNWKSATFSPLIRAAIFFFANLKAGRHAAEAAMLTELVYRAGMSGFYGALTQAFREVDPEWAASLAVMLAIPLLQHSIELGIHALRGTPKLLHSMIASVIFTAISTLFNLYAMRRGVLIVGENAGSAWSDLRALPATIAGFIAAGPVAAYRWLASINASEETA